MTTYEGAPTAEADNGFKVIPRLPDSRRGPKGRRLYDEMMKRAVEVYPEAIIAATNAPAHKATMVREAMETRLARPENAALAARGKFLVGSTKTGEDAETGKPLVEVYLAFVEHAEHERESADDDD